MGELVLLSLLKVVCKGLEKFLKIKQILERALKMKKILLRFFRQKSTWILIRSSWRLETATYIFSYLIKLSLNIMFFPLYSLMAVSRRTVGACWGVLLWSKTWPFSICRWSKTGEKRECDQCIISQRSKWKNSQQISCNNI